MIWASSEQTSSAAGITSRRAADPSQTCWEALVSACRPPSRPAKLWIVGVGALLVSLVILTIPAPAPDLGIDAGWSAVLNWAHERSAQFGRELVFTYGPLGYLVAPYCLSQPSATLVLANATFSFFVAAGLCLVAGRLSPLWRWTMLALFVFEAANLETRADLLLELGVFCWGLLCLVESGRRRKLCVAVFLVFAAFACLVKVTYIFVAALSVAAIGLCFISEGNMWLGLTMPLGLSALFVAGWLGAGQALSNVGAFLLNGFRISTGYDQAVTLEGLPMLRMGGFLLGLTALAVVWLRSGRSLEATASHRAWRRAAVLFWAAGLLFLVWKHSMVRLDRQHFGELAAFAPVLALSLEVLTGCESRFRWLAPVLTLTCCLSSVLIMEYAFLPGWAGSVREVFAQSEYHARWLLAPASCRQLLERDLEARRSEADLPQLRQLLAQSSVDVFGIHQAYALLNGLNYRPRPVFQSYAAYTRQFAELNEAFYFSPSAPDYVLLELSSLEHRFAALDDALAFRALLTNYEPLKTEGPFLLIKRKSADRVKLRLLQNGQKSLGERIDLSQYNGDNLWLELDVEPTLFGKIIRFFYRPPVMRLSIWSETTERPKRAVRRRAAPSLLRTGFVASPFLLSLADAQILYEGGSLWRPSAMSLEPDLGSEKFWQKKVGFRLFRIENSIGKETAP